MRWLETTLSDIMFAARALARRPLFAVSGSLTLALGIATATAMFTLVNAVVLRPLPYPDAVRLVELVQSYPEGKLDRWTLSQQNAAMYQPLKAFESFAVHARTGLNLTAGGGTERVVGQVVSGDFFKTLGVSALLGRTIDRSDDRPGGDNVVLSYGFWQSHFGGSPKVIGQTLLFDDQPRRVIGIAPSGFAFPKTDVQVYVPLGLNPTRTRPNFLTGLARLRSGVSAQQAEREATLTFLDWARRSPELLNGASVEQARLHAIVTPLRTAIAGGVVRPLVTLQIAVLLILLIAVANVATLTTTNGVGRRREVAVRVALGAERSRIVRQLLTESLVMAAVGCAVGIGLAVMLIHLFEHSSLATLPRVEEVGVDWRVLTFGIVTSAACGMLFGLIPALSVETGRLSEGLAGQKASAGRSTRSTLNALIGAQVALSFLLLVGAGLVLKSFQRLLATDLGFEPSHVMSVTMPLPRQRYMADRSRAYGFVDQVVAAMSGMPGVRSAAVMFPAMYVNDVNSDGFLLEGQDPAGTSAPQTVQYSASPGLFSALRVPLLAGRDFTKEDRADTPPVAVVDRALITKYWSPTGAIGKRIRMTGDTTWRTIVGVVGSVRDEGVSDAPRPHTYFPYAQYGGSRPTLVVRSDAADATIISDAKRAVAASDPGVPIDSPHPIAQAIANSLATRRVTEVLLVGFSTLALLLAGCGLYGVMALYVANRKREFGIRAAIGARPSALVRVVVVEGLVLVASGAIIGLIASAALGRSISSLLYEVSPSDVSVYGLVAVTLTAVAAVACYLPARRAANADPLVALRSD
jgi:putative ABC transport system permease protein